MPVTTLSHVTCWICLIFNSIPLVRLEDELLNSSNTSPGTLVREPLPVIFAGQPNTPLNTSLVKSDDEFDPLNTSPVKSKDEPLNPSNTSPVTLVGNTTNSPDIRPLSSTDESLGTRRRPNHSPKRRRHRHKKHHLDPTLPCHLTTFGMVFPNHTHHHAFAYRNISQFIAKMYFCAWIYPTSDYVTLLDVVSGSDILLQVEADMTKDPPKLYIYWQNKKTSINANGMKPHAWSHVCFEATKDKMCHLYVNNRETGSVFCDHSPAGWINGSAMLGQTTDPVTGSFVPGKAFTGVLAGLQMTRMDIQLGLGNTKLACMYRKCEKTHDVKPGDKSDLLYWPVSVWTLRDLSLKQFEVPCHLHNVDFILKEANEFDEENDLMDWEHHQHMMQLRKEYLAKLILK